jgi:hypothetical protein
MLILTEGGKPGEKPSWKQHIKLNSHIVLELRFNPTTFGTTAVAIVTRSTLSSLFQCLGYLSRWCMEL